MFDLYIYISRYVFLALMLIFLLAGLYYIYAARIHDGFESAALSDCSLIARVCILLTHILAYAIILWGPGSSAGSDAYYTAAGSFLFLVFAFILTAVVYRNSCRLIINCILYLMNIGLIMITRLDETLASRQLMWFAGGLALFLLIPLALRVISKSDRLSPVYLILGALLIISPFLIGVTRNGATNWIAFTVSGHEVSFQPSEAVKLLFVLYLACVFSKDLSPVKLVLPSAASMGFILVLTAQRDLGGALIFFITFMGMLYIGTNRVWLVGLGFIAFSGAVIIAYRVFSHIQVRIVAWRDPWSDITGAGWQIAQSLFAVGTWGPFGAGLTRGLPKSIPAAETDFIFAAISEEFGVVFGLGLIVIYVFILIRGVSAALFAGERYHSMLASGVVLMLMVQTFLIIGGNMRFIPLTGVTLPFVSYGGSSVVISVLMTGVLLWVSGRKTEAPAEEAEAV